MSITKIPVRTVFDNTGSPIGLSEFQVGEVIAIAQGGTSANTVANARVNLNITDANIRSLFSVAGSGSYNNNSGVFTITGGVETVGGFTGNVSNTEILSSVQSTGFFNTANIAELNNFYFSNARARAAFTAGSGIQLVEGVISVADTIDFGLIDGAVTSSNDLGSI